MGWKKAGLMKFATPIFDGATIRQINDYTDKAGLPRYGKTYLFDGGTGQKFDQPATVGIIYMLKLGHMVDDKMHARSIGPYSLLRSNLLVVKLSLEVSVLERWKYGHLKHSVQLSILQEILTVKSDDVSEVQSL
jgi:DNA-directed RNA polymerase subunit beta